MRRDSRMLSDWHKRVGIGLNARIEGMDRVGTDAQCRGWGCLATERARAPDEQRG